MGFGVKQDMKFQKKRMNLIILWLVRPCVYPYFEICRVLAANLLPTVPFIYPCDPPWQNSGVEISGSQGECEYGHDPGASRIQGNWVPVWIEGWVQWRIGVKPLCGSGDKVPQTEVLFKYNHIKISTAKGIYGIPVLQPIGQKAGPEPISPPESA